MAPSARMYTAPLPPPPPMLPAQHTLPLRSSTTPTPAASPPVPTATMTPPPAPQVSPTPGSRNDLFNTSWVPAAPPPRPLHALHDKQNKQGLLSSSLHGVSASSLRSHKLRSRLDNNSEDLSVSLGKPSQSSWSPPPPARSVPQTTSLPTPPPPPPSLPDPAPAMAMGRPGPPDRTRDAIIDSTPSGKVPVPTAHGNDAAQSPSTPVISRLQSSSYSPPLHHPSRNQLYSHSHSQSLPHSHSHSHSHSSIPASQSPRLLPRDIPPLTPSPSHPPSHARAHTYHQPALAVHTRSPSDSPPSPPHPSPFVSTHLVASPPGSPSRLSAPASGASSSPVGLGYGGGLGGGPLNFGGSGNVGNMIASPDPGSPGAGSKTSSFFESAAADTPPPAPRLVPPLAPSPLSLSRASSLRARALPARTSPPPPLMPDDYNDEIDETLTSPSSAHFHPSAPFSSLHQSPNLPAPKDAGAAMSPWNLPAPPAADDIALRLFPDESYLLGEGRHACVYLAAYKRIGEHDRGNRRKYHGLSRAAFVGSVSPPNTSPSNGAAPGNGNASGPGSTPDTEWTLCAAKRLAPDRESQTLGLREAFFLNRLSTPAPRRKSSRPQSPLGRDASRGRVYVVKLIAVKDEASAGAAAPVSRFSHARSVSDFLKDTPTGSPSAADNSFGSVSTATPGTATGSPVRRPRSSTIFATGRGDGSASGSAAPSPRKMTEESARLVLVLEHAPLGTLDRLLRTSPALVGQDLWGRWAREASEALEWVHSRGVVHADVKPSNLLLTADLHLRLSDFGSSLLVHPAHPPTDGIGLGTLPFSPPELVDPNAPFSFPVDIFALGATLYQCITGREPYRGSRPVEMMHHVRNGGLWAWEERERLSRVGTGTNTPAGESPYPSSTWAEAIPEQAALRRGGSLRVPSAASHRSSILPGPTPSDRTRLSRVGSAESLQAANDVTSSSVDSSPPGVKLWHHWMKTGRGRGDPVDRLLAENPSPPTSPTGAAVSRSSSLRHSITSGGAKGVSRSSSLRSAYSPSSPIYPAGSSPTTALPGMPGTPAAGAVYADGAPAMYFLSGERVPDDTRDVLRAMLDAVPEARPTAAELVSAWETLGVGVDEEVQEEGGEGEEGAGEDTASVEVVEGA